MRWLPSPVPIRLRPVSGSRLVLPPPPSVSVLLRATTSRRIRLAPARLRASRPWEPLAPGSRRTLLAASRIAIADSPLFRPSRPLPPRTSPCERPTLGSIRLSTIAPSCPRRSRWRLTSFSISRCAFASGRLTRARETRLGSTARHRIRSLASASRLRHELPLRLSPRRLTILLSLLVPGFTRSRASWS